MLFVNINLFIFDSFAGEYFNNFYFSHKLINNFLLSIENQCKIKC
ncbi:hypothetical protein EC2788150_0346 [Escherichia coli 2788150]|nr:hypothetical protein EC2788150_0346 [Escherichia coli 2788150]